MNVVTRVVNPAWSYPVYQGANWTVIRNQNDALMSGQASRQIPYLAGSSGYGYSGSGMGGKWGGGMGQSCCFCPLSNKSGGLGLGNSDLTSLLVLGGLGLLGALLALLLITGTVGRRRKRMTRLRSPEGGEWRLKKVIDIFPILE